MRSSQLARGGREPRRQGVRHFVGKGALRLDPETLAGPVSAPAGACRRSREGNPGPSRIAPARSNRDVDALDTVIGERGSRQSVVRDDGTVEVTVERDRRAAGGKRLRTRGQSVSIRLARGCRVTLTMSVPEDDRLRSAFGAVESVTDAGRLRIAFDGRSDTANLDPAATTRIDCGCAATVRKSQGMTADKVFVLPHGRMGGREVYSGC